MSLGEARKRTAAHRAQAGDGIDPRKPKPESKQLVTYEKVVAEFIKHWAEPRQRSWQATQNVLLNTFKEWRGRPFVEITRNDARSILRGHIDAGHKYKAVTGIAWIRKLWRWACTEDIVQTPLMDQIGIHIDKKPRERWFNDAEIAAIWRAADACTDPAKGALFKLLLLTASRKTALANMKWSDLKDDTWVTPFEHTKSRKSSVRTRVYQTPLVPLASRILSGLPRTDERVFPTVPTEPSDRYVKELVVNGAPKDFFYHAVRHTVASWAQAQGYSTYEAGLLLNHAQSGVTSGYQHSYPLGLKRALLEKWAAHVEKLVQPNEGVALLR
jgi:integrase